MKNIFKTAQQLWASRERRTIMDRAIERDILRRESLPDSERDRLNQVIKFDNMSGYNEYLAAVRRSGAEASDEYNKMTRELALNFKRKNTQ